MRPPAHAAANVSANSFAATLPSLSSSEPARTRCRIMPIGRGKTSFASSASSCIHNTRFNSVSVRGTMLLFFFCLTSGKSFYSLTESFCCCSCCFAPSGRFSCSFSDLSKQRQSFPWKLTSCNCQYWKLHAGITLTFDSSVIGAVSVPVVGGKWSQRFITSSGFVSVCAMHAHSQTICIEDRRFSISCVYVRNIGRCRSRLAFVAKLLTVAQALLRTALAAGHITAAVDIISTLAVFVA